MLVINKEYSSFGDLTYWLQESWFDYSYSKKKLDKNLLYRYSFSAATITYFVQNIEEIF